jgi:light-regulated signal transduction histidine kinase (bacteriophytochrome)
MEETVGKSVFSFMDRRNAQILRDNMENRQEGVKNQYELEAITERGVKKHVLIEASPLTDEQGIFIGSIAGVMDITERKRAKIALKEYAERLKRSNEDLERFAYISSHDLQEPLRTLVTFTQLLERRYQGKLDPDADEYLHYIVSAGKRMQTLIQDLLEFSRVNTKGAEIRPTDAKAVVDDALALLHAKTQENGATIRYDPLPTVMADPVQLRQVFSNLISNAIKFGKPGVPPEIRIFAKKQDGMVQFSVRDNGIGIEPQYYDRIFVIFQRLHGMDTYEGTGIGLAIVKRIIERHGGRIWVESEPGKGSTFHFTVPAAP